MKFKIFDIENWQEIGATLARNKTRTFLTAFGIFWGTAMLAMLLGGAGGLEGMLRRNFQGFATNMGGCFASRTTISYKGFNKGLSWSLNDSDVAFTRRATNDIDLSTSMCFAGASVEYATKSSMASILGVEADYFKIQLPVINEGRLINESDVSQSRKVATIGKRVASELFGDESPIGKFVAVNDIYFLVIGVVSQTSEVSMGAKMDDAVITPITTMRRAFNYGTNVDAFLFTAVDGHSPKDVVPAIWKAVRSNHPIHPDDDQAMWILDVSEEFKKVDNLFLGISLLALFVGMGTLLAGVIGIGNIMWIIVKERTQEIGIRRAIGAKPTDIIGQVLSESIVLTAVAGVAGICFAAGVLAIADYLTYSPELGSAHFQLTFLHALWIMVVFMVLGCLAGLVPAIKAMRIKPIEALNDK